MNSQEKVDLELDLLQSNFNFNDQKGEVYRILKRHDLIDQVKTQGLGALTPEAQKELDLLRKTDTNWGKILFRDAFNQEYNINISGGGEKVSY